MVDESKIIVEKMLDFLYTGDYPVFTPSPENKQLLSTSALQIQARLFALADKYAVSELCDTDADRYMNRPPDVYFSTGDPNRKLSENVLRFSRDNLEYLL